jgi:NAD(P)-dependent dehydrogenase (short-subunit alcohol dehydrogenase family)
MLGLEVGSPVETTEERLDRVNDVNLKSMFLTCKHVLPHTERQGKGRSSNIASVSGIAGSRFPTPPTHPRKRGRGSSGVRGIIVLVPVLRHRDPLVAGWSFPSLESV